jgi:peptide-methionine (S)-S-oxide reductase/lysine-specific demethylase/histidyl-hydroxylase NO66
VIFFCWGCFGVPRRCFKNPKGAEWSYSQSRVSNRCNPLWSHLHRCHWHAGSRQPTYDNRDEFWELLVRFLLLKDPTTLNRQKQDIGTQYRSRCFIWNDFQKRNDRSALRPAVKWWECFGNPIVTQLSPARRCLGSEIHHTTLLQLKIKHREAAQRTS